MADWHRFATLNNTTIYSVHVSSIMALSLQPGPRIGALPLPSPSQLYDEEGVAPQPQRARAPLQNITKLESSLAVPPASVITAEKALKAALQSVETSGPLPHPGGASNIAYAVTSGQTHPSWHHDTQSSEELGIAPNIPRLVGAAQSTGQSLAGTASRAVSSTASAAEQAGNKVADIVQTAAKDTQALPLPPVQPVIDVASAALNAISSGAANLANALQASLPGMRESISAAFGFAEEEIAPKVGAQLRAAAATIPPTATSVATQAIESARYAAAAAQHAASDIAGAAIAAEQAAAQGVRTAAWKAADAAVSAERAALGKASAALSTAKNTVLSAERAAVSGANAALGTAGSALSSAKSGVISAEQAAVSSVSSAASAVGNTALSAERAVVGSAVSAATAVKDAVVHAELAVVGAVSSAATAVKDTVIAAEQAVVGGAKSLVAGAGNVVAVAGDKVVTEGRRVTDAVSSAVKSAAGGAGKAGSFDNIESIQGDVNPGSGSIGGSGSSPIVRATVIEHHAGGNKPGVVVERRDVEVHTDSGVVKTSSSASGKETVTVDSSQQQGKRRNANKGKTQ